MERYLNKEHLVPALLILLPGYLLLVAMMLLLLQLWLRLPRAAASEAGDGTFYDSGQALGNDSSYAVAIADLDGDGARDAFTASGSAAPNRVWLNDGRGQFSGSGQSLGSASSEGVALADLDGDDAPDAFVANRDSPNRVWLNQGDGQFSPGQSLGDEVSRGVALGDLNGDGHPDAFVANQGANGVWFNAGDGTFSDSGQSLGDASSYDVALGDLDGDGDLDAFVANGSSGLQPDAVWLNQGGAQGGTPGTFADSGQSIGAAWSYAVALGDLDGDDDLDAFTASWFPHGNKVWLNQGNGTFSDSGQSLGDAAAIGVALEDLDGDDDLDAFVANNTPDGGQVWFNAGDGTFSASGQTLGADTTSYDGALADVDGDGDLDVFAANFGPDKLWLNDVPGLPGARFDVARETNDDGDEVYYRAAAGDALLPLLLGRPASQSLEVHARLQSAGGVTAETVPFEVGERVQYLNVVNPNPDPREVVTMTLSVTLPGGAPGPDDETDRLSLVFVDGGQGLEGCALCYAEWLGRLVGFDPAFGGLHHVDYGVRETAPVWGYYAALFRHYSPELSDLLATNPALLWSSLGTLDAWTPALEDLGQGNGSAHIISQAMVDEAEELVEGIESRAGSGLRAMFQREWAALDPDTMVGLDMDQAWDEVVARRPISEVFITLVVK